MFKKLKKGSLDAEGSKELDHWRTSRPENQQVFDQISDDTQLADTLLQLEEIDLAAASLRIKQRLGLPEKIDLPEKKRSFLYLYSTAAAVILLVASFYLLYRFVFSSRSGILPDNTAFIHPKGSATYDHAILTLADGQQIKLDSSDNNNLATEEGIHISSHQGALFYQKETSAVPDNRSLSFNEISTPVGGKYKLKLSDGTRVWLNTGSSIKYPVEFEKTNRNVIIKGEVYFEVAKDKNRPFSVNTGNMDIAVLGTSFDVMAYKEEDTLRTTLAEGAVEVRTGNSSKLLRRGQQASLPSNQNQLSVQEVNVSNALAWMNDNYVFKEATIKSIMRQIARWYAIKIIYKGAERSYEGVRFSGGINRSNKLTGLLNLLEADGRIHFSIEGPVITVSVKH